MLKKGVELFNWYNNALKTKPYLTKMSTSFAVYWLGDYICQTFIEKRPLKDYQYARTANQSLVGTFFNAPPFISGTII